jgi:CubicO group peptidase (beta-lactamase class C family)
MFHLKNRLSDAKKILADSTIDAMHRSTTGIPNIGYGIGWGLSDDENGLRRVAHSGGMPGVNTALYLYPEEDLAVVVLANTTHRAPFLVAQEIVASLVPRYADTLRARRARQQQQQPQQNRWSTPGKLTGEWKGTVRTWNGTVPFTLSFQQDGDVVAKLGDQPRALIWDPNWQGDSVSVGRFDSRMPTPDAALHRHTIFLNLTLRGTRLSGQASAQTVPPDTVFYARTSYVDLGR